MSSFHSNYRIAPAHYRRILLSLRAIFINTATSLLGSKGKYKPFGLNDNRRVYFRRLTKLNSVFRVYVRQLAFHPHPHLSQCKEPRVTKGMG